MTKYTHLCWQGTIQCSPRGHRTREAADRCAARHNSVLRSLGLLTEANRWIVRANPPRVEDLDYKDLFRDAVLMMAEIARAAGFDPKDENVEPPDIVARVENQRAEVERLTVDLTVARRLLPPRYIAADGSIMDPERCTPHASDCAECGRGRAHDEACLGLAATPAEESVGLRDAIESVTSAVERLTAERDAARRGATDLVRRAMVAAHHSTGKPPRPWWAHVANLFAIGSTRAQELCTLHGFDPEELI